MNTPPPRTEPAAFYGRVSTDQQQGSLDTQDLKSLDYARLKNLAIDENLKFQDEDTSGSLPLMERLGGARMVNTLKLYPGVKHLIVTKLDRLGRDAFDLEKTFRYFKSQGICVHIVDFGGDSFTTSGFLGDLVIRILAAVAEFERMMIKSRIQDRMNSKRAKGELCGTEPYGWTKAETGHINSKTGKPIYRLEINIEEQANIRKMWALRNKFKLSYGKIASEFNGGGIPTKTGKRWQCGNVAGVLESSYTKQLLQLAGVAPASRGH